MSPVFLASEAILRSRLALFPSSRRQPRSRIGSSHPGSLSCPRRSFAQHASDGPFSSTAAPTTPTLPPRPLGGPAGNRGRGADPRQHERLATRESTTGEATAEADRRRATEAPLPGRQQDILLLRSLLLATPPPAPTPVLQPADAAALTSTDDGGDWRAAELQQRLRTGDTRALFNWLVPTAATAAQRRRSSSSGGRRDTAAVATTLAEEEVARWQVAAGLPATQFSALLQCVDAAAVYAARDDAQAVVVTAGLAQFTPLGALVNRFGVRALYPALLRALLGVAARRLEAGGQLLLHDYVVLLRSAGAAADVAAAKRVWHEMEKGGLVRWRQSAAYAAFVQARFLTEPLALQQDTARLRVRPVNLHRQKRQLAPGALRPLEQLRRAQEGNPVSRFGQTAHGEADGDAAVDVVEPLTRILRKPRPVYRVLNKTQALGYAHDERLLAALIVAFGRTGSLAAVERILADFWKVRVVRVRTGTGTVVESVSGGAEFAPDAPMRPSAALLAAVVQAYGCHGEVACALQVLDFLARRYNVAVPERLWFDLLTWTYVMASRPVADEWRLAGLPGRVLRPHTVALVWQTMTGAPYHVRPGFAQYHLLVKMLIAQRRLDTALQLMRRARPLYQAQLRAHEAALLAHAAAVRQGVDPGRAGATPRLRRAAARKWHMRYCIQVWCRAFLRAARPRSHADAVAVRTIPQMVEAFWPFLPQQRGDRRVYSGGGARYRTVAGVVELREPLARPRVRYTTATVDLPALRPSLALQDDDGTDDVPFAVSFEVTDPSSPDDEAAGWQREEPYMVEVRAAAAAQATAEAAAEVEAAAASSSCDPDRVRRLRRQLRQRQAAEERLHARRLVRGTALRRRVWVRTAVPGGAKPELLGPGTSRAWLIREFA